MEQQQMLVVATVYEAMKVAAIAIAAAQNPQNPKHRKAWAKIVGHMLYPKKDPDSAGRYFADCLNPDRDETLDPEEFLWLKREAKRAGCHILHAFDCEESEYQISGPVVPEDQVDDLVTRASALKREFADLAERMERAAARMSKAQPLVR